MATTTEAVVSSAELARRAQQDDAAAMGELYRRMAGRALAAARCYATPNDAEDAVADGFVRALTFLHQLRDAQAVESWVIRCVVRAAIDLSRKRRRQYPNPAISELADRSCPPSESAAEWALRAIDHQEVATTLDALPPRTRTLLRLRYEATLSVREIAVLLNEPEGTVRRRCFEARRLARHRFLRQAQA